MHIKVEGIRRGTPSKDVQDNITVPRMELSKLRRRPGDDLELLDPPHVQSRIGRINHGPGWFQASRGIPKLVVKIADQERQIIPFGSVVAAAIVADTFTVAAALLLRHLSLVP